MKNKKHTPLLAALATLVMLLAGVVLIWLAKVRPDVGKGRSEIVTDFLRAELLQDGQTATQVFTYDKDILTIGLEFYLPGDQPSGALDVVLYDADTGEELSRSVGTMDYIVPDQYTTLGMDPAVTGQEGRRYKLAVTPHYATDAILAIGHSDGVALWKEQMAVDDRVIDGTMAMQITYQRIGGYLTRFFLLVGGLAAVLAALAVWAVLSKKLALHRLVFVLVLGFGLLYSFVLPPYAAPDEKYHINQSFTLACRWANDLSHDEWRMGKVPTTTSFRRVGDEDADLQNENTTVFTWEAFTSQLFTTTDQPFDSHQEYNELQTDQNPLLYVVSAAAVFLAYVLHFGFAPALFLGRLANLLLFAALAALAVKTAPFGKRVFTVAALLPMTLHLAASFSRDAPLLGLCFVFTALLMDAAFGPNQKKALSPRPADGAAVLRRAAGPGQARLSAAGGTAAAGARRAAGAPRQGEEVRLSGRLSGAGAAAEYGPSDRYAAQRADRGADHGGGGRRPHGQEPPRRAGRSLRGRDLRREYAGKLRQAAVLLRGRQPQPRGPRGRILGAGHAGGRRQPGGAGAEFPLFARQGQQLHRRPGILHDGLLCAAGHRCDRRQRGRLPALFCRGRRGAGLQAAVQPDQLCRELRRAGCGRRHDG
ncbi:DUF2142 domain-containing protein [Gemmiger formicilis]|uniref:DUF2142 domain-containing protein n=1 Tax=Gemmiger formicilis TaxID=745368 RepID=UPI0035206521